MAALDPDTTNLALTTCVLLFRGCPDEGLDTAADWLARQLIPDQPHALVAQVDEAIQVACSIHGLGPHCNIAQQVEANGVFLDRVFGDRYSTEMQDIFAEINSNGDS